LDRARVLLDQHGHLIARDALHAAVVLEHEMSGLCSFDSDFDDIQGITRIEPPEL
jgi:predicted nucleic acid-binding protein